MGKKHKSSKNSNKKNEMLELLKYIFKIAVDIATIVSAIIGLHQCMGDWL